MSPSPLLGLAPISSRNGPCFSKTRSKKTRTQCPKMMGSETFIIVAFRWSENSTPRSRASRTWSRRKETRACLLRQLASSTSPGWSGIDSFRTWTPSAVTSSTRALVGASTVTERSVCRKSPADMDETWVWESSGQARMRGGFFFEKFLTERGMRRSELP